MNLINIQGKTSLLRGATNTGIYVFEDNTVVIIDAGRSSLSANKIMKSLNEAGLELKYIISTHEHDDHTGANYDLKERNNDVEIYMSLESKLYTENPNLFSKYIMGGKTNNIMDGKNTSKHYNIASVDKVVQEGSINLNNKQFEIIELPGHTSGSIGILTPDNVLFVGDAIICDKLISKYDFLFLYDIQAQLTTLNKIESLNYDYMITGHGKSILSYIESKKIIDINRKSINKYIEQVLEFLNEPLGIDELLKRIILKNNLNYNYREYHYLKTSLISLISYLIDLENIDHILKDGELLYYNTKNHKSMIK